MFMIVSCLTLVVVALEKFLNHPWRVVLAQSSSMYMPCCECMCACVVQVCVHIHYAYTYECVCTRACDIQYSVVYSYS